MQIGRTIYYQSSTSEIIADLGERQGDVYQTDVFEDMNHFPELEECPLLELYSINLPFGYQLPEISDGQKRMVVDGEVVVVE